MFNYVYSGVLTLSLALFVLRVAADDIHPALAAHGFAVVANLFY